MKPASMLTAVAALLFVPGCDSPPKSGDQRLAKAEAVIDAFYSFNSARLRAALRDAPDSRPEIPFYQGWAEGGNYVVLDRKACRMTSDTEISCAITVRDDLIAALGTGYDVTDTFHLTLSGDRIVKVRTSSNDPPQFEQALEWLRRERPELMDGPCRGFFAGGPTPGDCVRAVVKGFADFAALPPKPYEPVKRS